MPHISKHTWCFLSTIPGFPTRKGKWVLMRDSVRLLETGLPIVPVRSYTLEVCGEKQVSVTGNDDKRQITAVVGCSLSGKLLPPQLLYEGKTD